jgi:hypothetical protein
MDSLKKVAKFGRKYPWLAKPPDPTYARLALEMFK